MTNDEALGDLVKGVNGKLLLVLRLAIRPSDVIGHATGQS